MKKVTKAQQAKLKKVAQKRADYTKARSRKTLGPRNALQTLLATRAADKQAQNPK